LTGPLIDDVARLTGALERARAGLIVVVTGAGISLASGIPTFRGSDPDAIWHHDVTEMATRRYFESDPAGSWAWYLRRFETVDGARPNPGHHALAALERWCAAVGGTLQVVTQNIDTLHEQAGTQHLIKVHGSIDRVRCSAQGACENASPSGSIARAAVNLTAFAAAPDVAHVPRCPACGSLLRPHVLWFDEYYNEHRDYRIDAVVHQMRAMDLVLFVGTSLAVGVTEMVLGEALGRQVEAYQVDPILDARHHWVTGIKQPAEELLPRVCARLGAALGT